MNRLLETLARINVAALACVMVILAGLLAGGANGAPSAALLSAALLCALVPVVLFSPRERVARTLRDNAVTLLAAAAFMALALASAFAIPAWATAPLRLLGLNAEHLSHPAWRAFGLAPGAPSIAPFRTIDGLAACAGPAAAFLLGALCAPPDRQSREWAARWIVAMALVFGATAIVYFFAHAAQQQRLDVRLGSANAAATLFAIFNLTALTLLIRAAQRKPADDWPPALRWASFLAKAPWSLLAIILATACLLLTASRGGMAAWLFGLAALAIAFFARQPKSQAARARLFLPPMLATGIIAAVLFAQGGALLMARLQTSGEDGRAALSQAHWQAFQQRPMIGHGLNTFHEINKAIATPQNWQELQPAGSAHNIYLQALEETGLIGLALWALMLGPLLARAGARIVRNQPGADWASAALAVSIVVLLHGAVDFGLQVPAIGALYAFIMGAFVGRAQR